jgi:hypothetical protein
MAKMRLSHLICLLIFGIAMSADRPPAMESRRVHPNPEIDPGRLKRMWTVCCCPNLTHSIQKA